MWIRMISTAAGPQLNPPLVSGHVYQVEDDLAKLLIAERAATEVADPRPKPKPAPAPAEAEAETETASIDEGEKAVEPGSEKKSETLMDKLKKPASKKS